MSRPHRRALVLLTLAALGAATSATRDAAADETWATSVNGPGPGKSQGLLGLGGVFFGGGTDLKGPAIAAGVVYGIADVADFQLKTDLGIVLTSRGGGGAVGIIDPSFMIRPLGERAHDINFGLKLGPEIVWLAGEGGGLVGFGMNPGLGVSFGSTALQATLLSEFPIYFAYAGEISGTGTAATVRPSFAIEGAVGDTTNLFLKIAPQLGFSNAASGFLFLTATAGVTF